MSGEAGAEPAKPVLRVVRGNPSDEEVAALLAVVLTRTEPAADRRSAPGWADRGSRVRRTPRTGAGGWRASAWR